MEDYVFSHSIFAFYLNFFNFKFGLISKYESFYFKKNFSNYNIGA